MTPRDKRRHYGARALAFGTVVCCAACASERGAWFSLGPRPSEIAGVWIDVARTSYSDTVAWVLAPNGDDRTLHIGVNRDADGVAATTKHETWNGMWYLSGKLTDTTDRAICFKRRVRDGATCVRFRMDTAGVHALRQMTVLGYQGQRQAIEHIFFERRRVE